MPIRMVFAETITYKFLTSRIKFLRLSKKSWNPWKLDPSNFSDYTIYYIWFLNQYYTLRLATLLQSQYYSLELFWNFQNRFDEIDTSGLWPVLTVMVSCLNVLIEPLTCKENCNTFLLCLCIAMYICSSYWGHRTQRQMAGLFVAK